MARHAAPSSPSSHRFRVPSRLPVKRKSLSTPSGDLPTLTQLMPEQCCCHKGPRLIRQTQLESSASFHTQMSTSSRSVNRAGMWPYQASPEASKLFSLHVFRRKSRSPTKPTARMQQLWPRAGEASNLVVIGITQHIGEALLLARAGRICSVSSAAHAMHTDCHRR